METMLRRPPHQEAQDFDCERRLYDDTTTWLAEVLPGSMRTEFRYRFNGFELFAQDGSELQPIFDDAIAEAEQVARRSPNLSFEVRRRRIEKQEYLEMLAIAKGELPNTMVVVSDFPPELLDAGQDVGGYNVKRRQTMLRVIARNSDGAMTMYSQSLDGSERVALEKMYQVLGFEAEPGELLGQRMHLDLSPDEQAALTDYLRDAYDESLAARYGGIWHAGRSMSSKPAYSNTYEFVRSQRILLEAFMRVAREASGPSEAQLYDLASEMLRRYEQGSGEFISPTDPASEVQINDAISAMQLAGSQARSENRTFSGCGMSLGGFGQTAESQLQSLGFGNKTNEETTYSFNKYMYCVVCQAPPKQNEKKRMCGPCGICRTCDTKIKAKAKIK